MVLVDSSLMKDSIIWSSDSNLFSSNEYPYDLKKSSEGLNSIVHRQTATPSYFNFWDSQTLEHSHDKALSPHCSMESTTSTWDFQPAISPEPLKDSLDVEDYYHKSDACLSSSLPLARLKYDISDMLLEAYGTQNMSKQQLPHTSSLVSASRFEAGQCDSPISNTPGADPSTDNNCVQHPSTSFSFNCHSTNTLNNNENGIICHTSFDSYMPQENSCNMASSVHNSSLLDDIRHPCTVSHENFSSEKILFPSKSILNYNIHAPPKQEQNNENNFDMLVSDALSQNKTPTLDTTSYASDSLFLDTQKKLIPVDYTTYFDPSSSYSFHKLQHNTDFSQSYKTSKDDLVYTDEGIPYIPPTDNSLQTPPLSTCSGPPSQDEKTEQMLTIEINSGNNPPYDPNNIANSNKSHMFDTFFTNETKNNTLPSDVCSDSLSWQQSQQNQTVDSYIPHFHSSDENKPANSSERPSDITTPCMYRLSRSPTARAAIVQYPYPPVPPHCLPPLKHTQQQALFNEYLKIERDALRVQLGHFIVEYCTRSIPDKYFRSERTPDPRIIKDFVDQVIFAVEIFGEQAQYVHAHNAIPTDINEVYISTWLQQKKEFLKPLEMLYVKREREKLLARQNTFAQMSPNTLSCFLQTQPRKSLCTPKTTRVARINSSLHSTDGDSIAQTAGTTKATTPSPRQRRSRDNQSASRASSSTTSCRGNLSLGEELDDLGVPRTIHFENLRSAIEHRGIVVQLPSNNTSGSITSCKRLNSSSRRNLSDSSFQYRSLFNLLISGRGDTRRSRLQLPWGDTVNIKYNRTLLGIPDFLVEGLGYSHLGSNHHLIPKVCAVSLEGSLYGVEVLLFYRGLPCTKRIAKRYVVQPYESKPSNSFRMYTKPQELQPLNRCTPNSIQSTEHPILHSELYTMQSRDVCFDTSFTNVQASAYAKANNSFDESTNKTEKQYRTLDPLLHKHKRLKQEEISHPLSIGNLTNLSSNSVSEIDPNSATLHHVTEVPHSITEEKYYMTGHTSSSCDTKSDFQWDEATNLDLTTVDNNCNVYYPNQYLENSSNSNQTTESLAALQWNPSIPPPSPLQTACENIEWKNSDVEDTNSTKVSLFTKIETTTPSQNNFVSYSSESPKGQFDNNISSLCIDDNSFLYTDENNHESVSSNFPYLKESLIETPKTTVPLHDSTEEDSNGKLTLDSAFSVQQSTSFSSPESGNAIFFHQDKILDMMSLQRQIFPKLNEPSTTINQASESCDNNTSQNSNSSKSIENYVTHPKKNHLYPTQEQWRHTTPSVDSETTLNAIDETATEETAMSVQRTRLMVSCSASEKHAGAYKTHTSLTNGRYRRKCMRKLKGTTFNSETPTFLQDTVTFNGPSTHKDPQILPEAPLYNYIQIPNYVNFTANASLPCTAHADDYYTSMYPSLYFHES